MECRLLVMGGRIQTREGGRLDDDDASVHAHR